MAHRGRANADDVLIAALAGGQPVEQAAAAAGVSPRTAWRRLQDPDFRQRLDDARQQTVQAAVDTLTRASTAAAMTLATLLKPEQRATVRLAAARAILELGGRMREAGELEARLAALEAAVAAQNNRRRA